MPVLDELKIPNVRRLGAETLKNYENTVVINT